MGAERWDEQVGSVADEAARLLESLRRSTTEGEDAPSGATGEDAPSGRTAEDPIAHDGGTSGTAQGSAQARPGCDDPFCQWCPLCRTSAVVRSLSPETLARLSDLAGVAAAVLADLAASRGRASTPDDAAPAPTAARSARPRTSPIPVDDAEPQED